MVPGLLSKLVDCVFGLQAKLLLPGRIADGAGSVADDVITVPRARIHRPRALRQSLGTRFAK